MDKTIRVSAILIAAGLSRRMGEDKLLLPYRGLPLLSHALCLISGISFHEKILVTTQARLSEITLPKGIEAVINPYPETGQSGSVKLGVAAATGDAYMFFTADQPLLDHDTAEFILRHADLEHIVYPAVNGVPFPPSIFPARYRKELLTIEGDQGGRTVRKAHPGACLPLDIHAAASSLMDVDTWEDYTALLSGENETDGGMLDGGNSLLFK